MTNFEFDADVSLSCFKWRERTSFLCGGWIYQTYVLISEANFLSISVWSVCTWYFVEDRPFVVRRWWYTQNQRLNVWSQQRWEHHDLCFTLRGQITSQSIAHSIKFFEVLYLVVAVCFVRFNVCHSGFVRFGSVYVTLTPMMRHIKSKA